MLDDCEPDSFNAGLMRPDACVGDGETTFAEFIDEFLATGSVDEWEFKPSHVQLKAREGLHVVNVGGEFHTFTPVAKFGGGCVPELNGTKKPVDECTATTATPDGPVPTAFLETGLPPGGSKDITDFATRIQRYECLIHPWMRTTVVVRAHH